MCSSDLATIQYMYDSGIGDGYTLLDKNNLVRPPLLAPIDGVHRGAIGAVADELQPYFRDVQDHLRLVNEEVTAQRDLLTTCLEANMAVISVEQTRVSIRQNETTKLLTIIATVFLPLTFVTGFFGQNFGWLVRHIDTFGDFAVLGIGGMIVPGGAIALLLYRAGYLNSDGQ